MVSADRGRRPRRCHLSRACSSERTRRSGGTRIGLQLVAFDDRQLRDGVCLLHCKKSLVLWTINRLY